MGYLPVLTNSFVAVINDLSCKPVVVQNWSPRGSDPMNWSVAEFLYHLCVFVQHLKVQFVHIFCYMRNVHMCTTVQMFVVSKIFI